MEYDFPFSSERNDEFYSQLDEDLDFALALSLQADFESEIKENEQNNAIWQQKTHSKDFNATKPLSIVDKQWELLDPHPDINGLFLEFNKKFFDGVLAGVEVRWSSRMTLCAGVCSYEGRGGLCSVRLSMPLLKLRPRRDLVETLLHEMIHALLFVTNNNKDHDAHGPEFLKHMHRINQETGTRISVYHNFHDEVDLYRKHWWKCNGPCQKRSPYFGFVKRAMNRAPGPRDTWWSQHLAMCGGTYTKVNEPEDYKSKTGKRKALIPDDSLNKSGNDIRNFFTPSDYPNPKKAKYSDVHAVASPISTGKTTLENGGRQANIHTIHPSLNTEKTTIGNGVKQSNVHTISSQPKVKTNITPFTGHGFTLGSSASENIPKFPQYTSKGSKSSNVATGNKDKGSVKVRIPGFYNSTPGTSSSSKGRNKFIGKNKTSFGAGSTSMRTSTGSKTIVLNKPPRTKTPEKTKSDVRKEPKLFSGQGLLLGSSSSTGKMDRWQSVALRDKKDKLVQSPIEKFFSKTTVNDSSKDDFKTHNWSCIFSDTDSDDSLIIGSPSKSINAVPNLPENAATSTQRSAGVVDLLDVSDEDLDEISYVNCPVCNKSVKNTEINNHLDMCLT